MERPLPGLGILGLDRVTWPEGRDSSWKGLGMELGLTTKVVGITGAAEGIGRAIARQMAAEGCRLLLCDINTPTLEQTRVELAGRGAEVLARRVDVTETEQVQAFVNEGCTRFGGIDVWVNNAGIYPQKVLVEMSVEEWDRVFAVNLRSLFLCTRAVAPVMKGRDGGVILNAASFAGLVPSAGSGAYAATKAAVLSLTRTYAAELAPWGIRVVAYAPGVIETPMTQGVIDARRDALVAQVPLHRLGTPEDVAKAIAFLASDAAGYITGTHLEITGGKLCVQNPELPWRNVARDGGA